MFVEPGRSLKGLRHGIYCACLKFCENTTFKGIQCFSLSRVKDWRLKTGLCYGVKTPGNNRQLFLSRAMTAQTTRIFQNN